MNKYRIAKLLLAITLIYSCTGEEIPSEITSLSSVYHSMSVSKNSIQFGYNTDLIDHVIITANNTDWEISGCPEWLTLSQTSGHGTADIQLTARENKSADVTYADKITIQSLSPDYIYSKSISVSQEAASPFVSPVNPVTYSFAAQSDTIAITSSTNWYAVSSINWLTAKAVNNEQLQISMTENQDGKERTATIFLKRVNTNSTESTITVTQSEGSVTGSIDTLSFGCDGGTLSRVINSDVLWTATVSDNSWISVTPSNGQSGNNTLKVTASSNTTNNQRNGFVYVKIGNITKLSIPVNQEAPFVSPAKTSATYSFAAQSDYIAIASNTNWYAEYSADWLTVTPVNSEQLQISMTENQGNKKRTATVFLKRVNTNSTVSTITVTQSEGSVTGSTDALSFGCDGGTLSRAISAEVPWTASISDNSWISVTPSNGQSGNNTLKVIVSSNTTNSSRSGAVYVKIDNVTKLSIPVNQEGISIKANPTSLSFGPNKAQKSFTVESNTDWKVSSTPSWISLSASEGGKGKTSITVNIEDNPNKVSRSGQIMIVKDGSSVHADIDVWQEEGIIVPNENDNELPTQK